MLKLFTATGEVRQYFALIRSVPLDIRMHYAPVRNYRVVVFIETRRVVGIVPGNQTGKHTTLRIVTELGRGAIGVSDTRRLRDGAVYIELSCANSVCQTRFENSRGIELER